MKKLLTAIAFSVSMIASPIPASSQQPNVCFQALKEAQEAIGFVPMIQIQDVPGYYEQENALMINFIFNSLPGRRDEGWDNDKNKLATAADQVLTQCSDDVRVIRFSQSMAGYHLIYGPVNGRNQWFECAVPGRDTSIRWGQQYCGL